MVKFLKVNVPSLTMDQPVVVIMMVPADGANILSAFTVNVPAIENGEEGCVEMWRGRRKGLPGVEDQVVAIPCADGA